MTDVGSQALSDKLIEMEGAGLRILNLQMNFIKDRGAEGFIDGLSENLLPEIWKIILLDNQCTEAFKRKAKRFESLIV